MLWLLMLQAYEKKLKQEAAKAAQAAAAAAQQQQQAWGNAAAGPKKSLAEIQVHIIPIILIAAMQQYTRFESCCPLRCS